MSQYDVTIGIEIHCELKTKTKMFSEADLLALQRAVGGHGLAHSAGAQNGDRHVFQITHVHCDILLKRLIVMEIGRAHV